MEVQAREECVERSIGDGVGTESIVLGAEEQPTIQGLRPGQAVKLKNGVRVFNFDGAFMKLIAKKKTGQRRGKPGIPFPGQDQMRMVTATLADAADQQARSGSRGISVAANAALNT